MRKYVVAGIGDDDVQILKNVVNKEYEMALESDEKLAELVGQFNHE